MSEQPTLQKAVFRIPATAVLGAALLAVAATPFAFGAPGLQVVYLVPIAIVVWTLRNRTTVTAEGLVARSTLARHEFSWSQLRSLRMDPKARVRAVLEDGSEVPLPAVRARHLPVLALLSGGRLTDPTATATATSVERDAEPETEQPSGERSDGERSDGERSDGERSDERSDTDGEPRKSE